MTLNRQVTARYQIYNDYKMLMLFNIISVYIFYLFPCVIILEVGHWFFLGCSSLMLQQVASLRPTSAFGSSITSSNVL